MQNAEWLWVLWLLPVGIAAALLPVLVLRLFRAWKYRIRGAAGIQKAGYIRIGGIDQYIQLRGQDIANPMILMLHGGPGVNMAFYSYHWQTPLEDRYTIVHYDQRGCGNNYYRNRGRAEKPTLELLLSDLDEVVDHLRRAYGKEKIILAGHSWGSFLGAVYAGAHPEKIAAFVGVSQVIDFIRAEWTAAREAMRLANDAGRPQDAQGIDEAYAKVCARPKFERKEFLEFMELRKLTGAYLPHGRSIRVHVGLFSPYVTLFESFWFLGALFHAKPFFESYSELYQLLFSGKISSLYTYTARYEMPVLFLAGQKDWVTPAEMVIAYLAHISAPKKELLWIEQTGHAPFMDRPAAFAAALRKGLEALGDF
ncbi:MAG: alpha/beta hydrolase [Clostridiales bacterium]|nr:alpha/beta hydrolase [Clostridiales bacterium]